MFSDGLGEETEALELISGRICCVGLTENLIKAVKVVRKKPGKGTEEDSEGRLWIFILCPQSQSTC